MVSFYNIFLWFWQRIIFFPYFLAVCGCMFGSLFLFSSYFTAFYGDGSHYSGRLPVGLFFNKVTNFGGGGFWFSVGWES